MDLSKFTATFYLELTNKLTGFYPVFLFSFLCVCVGEGGGSNWLNFGTFYDYEWIIFRSR